MKTKQTLILFLIALTMIVPIQAVERKPPPPQSERWKRLSGEAKLLYIVGVYDGISQTATDAHSVLKYVDIKKYSQASDELLELFDQTKDPNFKNLIAGMDYLYSDPANQYISLLDVLRFARDRSQGIDIEESLQKARKEAFKARE